ncbi:blr8254 [Bradyrhizobium diazoefficiens USDA 110]|uniref:Blr8254 protein n=2 Tax=Bradyrhizobium TaxID=374 RepID=Q89BA8_BRADU|nr:hypothetical protein CIT37_15205 [Bradyrhizobium ottawaense]MYV88423.1 hypothetical protein [Bradyrhizobium japonicum]NLS74892.1 hypothetical protein [Bradyrhizobium brasilense]NWL43881.1 hypothetical protein [Bradyrhizobium elkanii]PDT55795.1 hypothetical protein CO678_41825 [Bradyrhizobium diazoefficiens]QOZ14431.1 hypothetical protein XI02_04685 [Bradyrhizobium sp. CCBAU 21365]BAC53519.1 blr8254 [Bradyrhizobium diazoefficiens USDA 110]
MRSDPLDIVARLLHFLQKVKSAAFAPIAQEVRAHWPQITEAHILALQIVQQRVVLFSGLAASNARAASHTAPKRRWYSGITVKHTSLEATFRASSVRLCRTSRADSMFAISVVTSRSCRDRSAMLSVGSSPSSAATPGEICFPKAALPASILPRSFERSLLSLESLCSNSTRFAIRSAYELSASARLGTRNSSVVFVFNGAIRQQPFQTMHQ